ncbi:Dual specificity protein phosphatase, putative [Hondaea fermentalgiana]|uniref:Dual specificity protein phosphatase, putative n=1 Tax=Hondaea fermentalgiana TaxID=2315210 RepID=A0A2R5GSB5_9STRA|nr:Dual specificity protein phosphatase, putative [Hondaea fermentalgiana]|eukprot:GBG33485.1 Dual specificity protein phosphatase, putative [Hondaea fermentalgiana]
MKASKAGSDEQFDDEAQMIFAALNLDLGRRERYNALDAIYKHPDTGAQVFVGNRNAASSKEILDANGIKRVVNCTGDMENFFEDDDSMHYMRFRIATWMQTVKEIRSNEACLAFAEPMLEFVDTGLELGESVLIHCLAGAHRAGTTGVIVLMHKLNEPFPEALLKARLLRPVINPIGTLKLYAERYSIALAQTRVSNDAFSSIADHEEEDEDVDEDEEDEEEDVQDSTDDSATLDAAISF